MEADFWLERWSKQEIGFHLAVEHPLLKKFYSKLFSAKANIFVPLCGKSCDLKFFIDKGHPVLGCELSSQAICDFFQENNLAASKLIKTNFEVYQSNEIDLLVGDYFNLAELDVANFSNIYDRAALIALPKAMRKKYVAHLQHIFPTANMMLIILEYPQSEMNGPPFSVDNNEVLDLFSFASVEQIYSKNILSKEPRFQKKGLSFLNEMVYHIQW